MRTLTFSLLFVSLIATVGLGWIFDRAYEQYMHDEQHSNIDTIKVLEQLGEQLAKTLNNIPDKNQFVAQWQKETDYQLEILPVTAISLPQTLLTEVKTGKPLLLESSKQLTFHYYLARDDEILILKSALIDTKRQSNSINYLITVIFYLLLIVLFLVWVYPLIKQLISLRRSAKAFGEGDLSQRIIISPTSYIRDIQLEFNHMAKRIEDLVSDVKLLSSAVSHDLRTPLARIRFGFDTLQEESDPVNRQRFEAKISNNIDEMTSLVETLLNYARLDQVMLELKRDKIDLSLLLQQCIEHIKTTPIDIAFIQTEDEAFVIGDKQYLKMLFNNLLQNAINYGNGKLLVKLIVEKTHCKIIIADNGDGIQEALKQNILKPFVRGDDENTIKGHGIGLAIVKRILDWHDGDIAIANSPELLGAQFTIRLVR